MAYGNYLLKVGTYEVPLRYIKTETYSVLHSTTDLDSYRDANGVLHRNALAHKVNKVEFSTPPMFASDFNVLMSNISSQYTNTTEKKCSVSCYIPEIDSYETSNMYVPDITVSILENNPKGFIYDSVRIAFIGY